MPIIYGSNPSGGATRESNRGNAVQREYIEPPQQKREKRKVKKR